MLAFRGTQQGFLHSENVLTQRKQSTDELPGRMGNMGRITTIHYEQKKFTEFYIRLAFPGSF